MAHLAVPDTRHKVRVFLQILQNYPDVLEKAILYRQLYVGVYSTGQDRNFSTVLGKFPTVCWCTQYGTRQELQYSAG
jgi:hypothetical protein